LGLVDGLGNADEILKEKFGEDVVIKKFEKPKSWLNKKLSGASENQIENLLNILEKNQFGKDMASRCLKKKKKKLT